MSPHCSCFCLLIYSTHNFGAYIRLAKLILDDTFLKYSTWHETASAFWKKAEAEPFFLFIAAFLQLHFCRPGHHCWRFRKIHCFIWQLTDLRFILTSSNSFVPRGLQLLFKCQTWAAAGVLFENSHSTYKLGRRFLPDAGQFSLLAFSACELTCKILPFNIYCRTLLATIRFRSSNSIGGGADTAENRTHWAKLASSQVSGTKPTSDWKKRGGLNAPLPSAAGWIQRLHDRVWCPNTLRWRRDSVILSSTRKAPIKGIATWNAPLKIRFFVNMHM